MFPFSGPPVDDSVIRPLGDDDQRLLLSLVHRYGLNSLMCALTGLGESSRASAVSGNTLASAPSLVWTASDNASIRTQSTGADVPAIHEVELGNSIRNSWLESPCAITSPEQNEAACSSPRMQISTLKKYQCPMCFLDHNLVEFGRKSDFKKHLNNFHGTDVVWICRTRGCHLTFATERSYSTHAKEMHKMEALPSSAARTDLCPQLVFSCGFGTCKDRIFEAGQRDDAGATRDKYFEHIAKHFEDDFNVNDWDYTTLIHNLMRQQRVKSIWKTCIWPKEKRTALSWRARSSGDLKRMLECRHLGEDISQLVRLAFILGTAPFTSSRTPPPSEIDIHFQLPYRSQCLLETDGPVKTEDNGLPTLTISKSRPNSMFRLPSRKGKGHKSRPSTPPTSVPTSMPSSVSDTQMGGSDVASGPHPGTPIHIPNERPGSVEELNFAPEPELPKQMNTPVSEASMNGASVHGSPAMYTMPIHEDHQGYQNYYAHPPTSMPDGFATSPYETSMPHHDNGSEYGEMIYTHTPGPIRPATPVPHKRPASWSRHAAMEEMRPKKKANTPHGSPYGAEPLDHIPMASVPMDQVPNAYGEMIPPLHHNHNHHHHQQAPPTSVPQEWALPMRMGEQSQGGYHHHQHYTPQHDTNMAPNPMTFFFDDTEGRM